MQLRLHFSDSGLDDACHTNISVVSHASTPKGLATRLTQTMVVAMG